MARQTKFEGSCKVVRTVLCTSGKYNMLTGQSQDLKKEWRTEPCGAPVWSGRDESGVCASCAKGWSSPHNYPTDTPEAACPGCDDCRKVGLLVDADTLNAQELDAYRTMAKGSGPLAQTAREILLAAGEQLPEEAKPTDTATKGGED